MLSISKKKVRRLLLNAHHKRDDDIGYHLFYFESFDGENFG